MGDIYIGTQRIPAAGVVMDVVMVAVYAQIVFGPSLVADLLNFWNRFLMGEDGRCFMVLR
jgi:hypothetical protein